MNAFMMLIVHTVKEKYNMMIANMLKLIFGRNIYNAGKLKQLQEEIEEQKNFFHNKFILDNGYDINDTVIETIAVKRLYDCYDYLEIKNCLTHYKQLK